MISTDLKTAMKPSTLSAAPLPLTPPRALRWIVNDLRAAHRCRRQLRRHPGDRPGQYIDPAAFLRRKQSDTLFILGTGRSVLKLGDDDWATIGAADTVGLNFWMLHDFVPTYYMFEPAKTPERETAFLDAISGRVERYRDVLFLANGRTGGRRIDTFPGPLRNQLYLYAPYYLPVDSTSVVTMALRVWHRGLRLGLVGLEHAIHHRSSLSAAVAFGLLAGYRALVLVGVDLNHAGHFYDGSAGAPVEPTDRTIHATADPDRRVRRLTIDTYLDLFEKLALRPRGVRLYLAHDGSRLHPRHPVYPAFNRTAQAACAGPCAARA